MHPDTALEKESLVVVLDRGIPCYLGLEQKVQSLFRIDEPMLFHYQDSDNQTILVVNDTDLFILQESIKKEGITNSLFALTQRAFLVNTASPVLVKPVLKRYLSNFNQNNNAIVIQSFRIALFHVESVLNELKFPPKEVQEFKFEALTKFESHESDSNSEAEAENSVDFQDNKDDLEFDPDEMMQIEEFTGELEVNKNEMVYFEDGQLADDFEIDSKILSSFGSDAKDLDHFTKVSSTNEIRRQSELSNQQIILNGKDLKNESLLTCKNDSQIFNISDSFSMSYDGAFLKTKRSDSNMSYQLDGKHQTYK